MEQINAKMALLTASSSMRDKVEVLSQYVSEKSDLECEEDFFSMTIFSYMKCNAEVWNEEDNKLGWGIKAEK